MSSILYGPVPSWRLGRSLGVDLLPAGGKTCSLDCIYCQLGRTARRLTVRAEFIPLNALARELEAARNVAADYVTFSGMGEPTLASNLGDALRLARDVVGLPTAVLTNSSLMAREDVQRDLAYADVVVAKLDAPDERLFRRINRPVAPFSLAEIVEAIGLFRATYKGKLALQIMFAEANRDAAGRLAAIASRLSPDEIQINTPLRPCPVAPLPADEIAAIRAEFHEFPNVVTVYDAARPEVTPLNVEETRRRRPSPDGLT
jgi:wyosine [tRNA(Phe)-imidazoG37] synthetase (radical SAM superfamily)